MNTPSMEVIFLILSGVILMAGILYWFWSHIQLTQKKVQLLENAVFELRGMLANKGPESPAPIMEAVPSIHTASPAAVYKDIKDDEEEDDWAPVTPLESGSDLVPGGHIDTPVLTVVEEEVSLEQKLAERSHQETQFRDLFVPTSPSPKTETVVTTVVQQPPSASLESMPVKDLRRLAEERGIAGVAEMRKKDILAALRSQIPAAERTVDIAELVNPKVEGEEEVVPVIDNDIKEIPILE
jgi:hypothetical protein